MNFVKGLLIVSVFALLVLASGCSNSEPAPSPSPAGASPKATVKQALDNPNIPDDVKQRMRSGMAGPPK